MLYCLDSYNENGEIGKRGETMKKINGRLLSLFLILVMAVSAAACGGAGSDGNGAFRSVPLQSALHL